MKIAKTVEGIEKLFAQRVPGDGVDREVPAGQILLHPVCELHHRPPSEGLHVPAEGGDLDEIPGPGEDAHGAVLDTDGHGAPEEALNLIGTGPSGQVPVPRLDTEKGVPDRAPDGPRLVARLLQGLDDAANLGRCFRSTLPYPTRTAPPLTFMISPVM